MSINPLPFIISLVGVYFLFKLKFFFVLHPIRTSGKILRVIKDRKTLKSFCLALAGTLGVGNVFGVAFGIMIGGPGSVFWLLVSMLFAMIIKYCEVVITSDNLHHDRYAHGGMFYVISKSFRKCGRILSVIYAASTLALALFMGASLQCGTVVSSVREISDISSYSVAIIVSVLTLFVIVGGAKKIEKITSVIIPMTTIIYIFGALCIIISNLSRLPNVLDSILTSAFSVKGAFGGIAGFLMSDAIREGFARGILSNEAGAGTSSIAHARNGVLNPAISGLLGIFEVWFDTGLLCMLTAFSVLLSVPESFVAVSGMDLIMYSVGSTFGNVGKWVALILVFFFAFATAICWYYYGLESWGFVFGKKFRALFLPLFVIFTLFGSNSYITVFIVDVLMSVATVLCVCALMKNSDRIKTLSERGGIINVNLKGKYLGNIKGSVLRKEVKDREP